MAMGKEKKKSKKSKKAPKLNFKVLFRIYKMFFSHYREQWKLLTLGYSSIILVIMVGLALPLPLKLIIDHVILDNPIPLTVPYLQFLVGKSTEEILIILCGLFVLLHFLDMFISYINKIGLLIAAERMIASFRERVFAHLQRLSLSFHTKSSSGDIVYRMTTDITELRALLVVVPQELVRRTFAIIFYVGTMFYINENLALIALGVLPFIVLVNRKFTSDMRVATKKKKKKESKVSSVISDNIAAMALVQAYGREDMQHARFVKENQRSKTHQVRTIKLSKIFKRINAVLVAGGTAIVIYWGGLLVLDDVILPGTIVLFSYYLRKLYGPIDKFSEILFDAAKSQVSGERLLEMMETKMVLEDAPDARTLTSFSGSIEFRNVCFGYEKETPVLDKISFRINAGDSIAIVGHSGAGKSTLVSMLMRFYDPDSGAVFFDEQDIRTLKIRSVRDKITILLQEAQLFNQSVYENIGFGKDNPTKDEIVRAAKLARADEFIRKLPQGYDTIISENGENLSGGQKQRLNFARAMMRSTPITILDEPTTALDAKTEIELQAAFDVIQRNSTTIIIAHKISTIARADKIIHLGRESFDFGSHPELIANCPEYRAFFEAQIAQGSESKVKDETIG